MNERIQKIQGMIAQLISMEIGICESTLDLFPIGSIVRVNGVVCGKVCGADCHGFANILFENGNCWPKPIDQLELIPDSEVPDYYKRIFGVEDSVETAN